MKAAAGMSKAALNMAGDAGSPCNRDLRLLTGSDCKAGVSSNVVRVRRTSRTHPAINMSDTPFRANPWMHVQCLVQSYALCMSPSKMKTCTCHSTAFSMTFRKMKIGSCAQWPCRKANCGACNFPIAGPAKASNTLEYTLQRTGINAIGLKCWIVVGLARFATKRTHW